jgi:predicted ATPase
MIISRVILTNWRNFRSADIPLGRRAFLVGPNASGKSNFLDAFRFLRDIAKSEGGGLQKAVSERGGISKIRCLAARRDPQVGIEVHFAESHG